MNEFRHPLAEAAALQHHHDGMGELIRDAALARTARPARPSRRRGRRSPDDL